MQGFDHVRQQLEFDLARIWQTAAVGHEQIADHALAAFIYKKRVAEDAAAFDGGIAGKNFRIHITQNHLRRPAVVPRKQAGPDPALIVEQGAQINGGKMSEVENLHGAPAESAPFWLRSRWQNFEFSGFADARQTAGTQGGNIANLDC